MTERYKQIGYARYMDGKYKFIHDQLANVIIPFNSQDNCFSVEDLQKCGMFSNAIIAEYIAYGLTHNYLTNATNNPSICVKPHSP